MADPFYISSERPMLQALGDSAMLIRFGSSLDEVANRRAIAFAAALSSASISGILEIVPSLVSVLVRYDPRATRHQDIEGEMRLLIGDRGPLQFAGSRTIRADFGGEAGPDLEDVASSLGISSQDFIARHNATPLRVLATGFAPGFVYCGFHPPDLVVPRRSAVRSKVPAGSILFAAGQTAIAATEIPTGWHLIGCTDFTNFDPSATPPTQLRAGETVHFEAA